MHPLAILLQVPAMIAVWDRDGRNVFANPAYAERFGLTPTQIVGEHVREVMGPEAWRLNRVHVDAVLSGVVQVFERTFTNQHGRECLYQVSYTPNIIDGRPDGFIALVTDITARMKAEFVVREAVAQIALLEERVRLAADLHDVVLQRLFGMGLQMAAAQQSSTNAVGVLSAAVDGIDGAIVELRTSIHRLHDETEALASLPAAVCRVATHAAQALGFQPTVTIVGPAAELPATRCRNLLAVLGEALDAIARTAAAHQVTIELCTTEEQVRLLVSAETRAGSLVEGSSRLDGLLAVAQYLGGSLSWLCNSEDGSIVDWSMPRPRQAGRSSPGLELNAA
jgi:PAS domain S-box-containing protein